MFLYNSIKSKGLSFQFRLNCFQPESWDKDYYKALTKAFQLLNSLPMGKCGKQARQLTQQKELFPK